MPRPGTAFFTPELPPPSKPAKGGAGEDISLPYTSLFTAALSCGLDFQRASRMRFPELSMLVRARNESVSSKSEGKSSRGDGRRVRDATQADIRKFMS